MERVLSKKLVEINPNLLAHWCPACDGFHLITVNQPDGFNRLWFWNNDVNRPTFTPNLGVPNRCHYRITAGEITFLPDCNHVMVGRRCTMPDVPSDLKVELNVKI